MSPDVSLDHISKKTVVYRLPGANAVSVRRDVEFRAADGGALTMDLYGPPDAMSGSRLPAVIVVAGYPDPGFQKMLGCRFKEMGSSVSWGRLLAASGMSAITYTNREPVADLHALLESLGRNAEELGIDRTRIGIWASSGNVPLALSLLMEPARETLKCAALCYGYMLDLDGSTRVAEAARTWRFANPCEGRTVNELPRETPLFIARAGQDQMPGLNESIDRFVARALARNLPVTLVNHPDAPHAFDLFHDSETTREVIGLILGFLRRHLAPPASA
jgi:hypothetical protein